ncbi:MAG: hypothetical protein LLG93_08900 [Deltaproteobacteria bacterium]|nr:hypothetical protein [Deltaproteobacteria bacterium]
MSNYNLVRSGLIQATDADGAGPKTFALPSPVKTTSAFVVGTISESRTGPEVGARLRLADANTVELAWDNVLPVGDYINAQFYVYDVEDVGDDVKTLLFGMARIAALAGRSNVIQDLPTFNSAGVLLRYRLRVFDSKANAEAATIGLAEGDPLQAGELERIIVSQGVSVPTNDRTSLIGVQTHVAATPGVG